MRPSSWGILGLASILPLVFIQVNCDVIIERADNRRPYRIYEDQPARFGNALPTDGLVGLIVPVTPITACVQPSPPPSNVTLPKNVYFIALIRRSHPGEQGGECTFQSKVENAQKAGYSGAIVYNYLDDELIPMGGDADVLIPSVFVGKTDGQRILTQYSYPVLKYYVRITENPPFDINSYLLPFAVVVGICFLIMFGIMVFKCVQDRRRERRHRLPKSSLKKIPTKKFSTEDENRYETCCICLEDYELGDKLRILPCDHAYHMKCIDPWLLKNKRVCPQCRKKVFASGEIPPSDTESETEDERAPLLARPRATQGGTFTTQNENPFRRAARRLARRAGSASRYGESSSTSGGERGRVGGPRSPAAAAVERSSLVRSSSPGASSTTSSSTEGGSEYAGHTNQLVTQVYIEQPARMPQSPTSSAVSPPTPPPSTSSNPPLVEEGAGGQHDVSSPPPAQQERAASKDEAINEVVTVVDVENEVLDDDQVEDDEIENDQAPLLQTNEESEDLDMRPVEDPVV